MRHTLIAALMLSLVAGCSSTYIGQHRIDVQQGNALDHESIARLKPGLSRTQVRFLLGTPLLVDPFRTDRWDYVYMFYAAGKLTEQKHVALYFDGDTLTRIEGDVPAAAPGNAPAVQPPVTPAAPDVPAAVVAPAAAPAPAAATEAPASPVQHSSPANGSESSVVAPLPSPNNVPPYVDPHTPAEPSPAADPTGPSSGDKP